MQNIGNYKSTKIKWKNDWNKQLSIHKKTHTKTNELEKGCIYFCMYTDMIECVRVCMRLQQDKR